MASASSPLTPEGTRMTQMCSGGRRKVHYTFPDHAEMVEEYSIETDQLLCRKRRGRTMLGKESAWVYEVGEAPARVTIEHETLRVNTANPALTRIDRPHAFEWRIRNLPYDKTNYSVEIEGRQIVVRTVNKKYYKRIGIEDMERAHLDLEARSLSWSHENNTLVVTYKKPKLIVEAERESKRARLAAPDEQSRKLPEEDVGCKQQ